MNSELQSLLYTHLGELMHQQENEFDWIEKNRITEKTNAVYTLLEIDKKEESTMRRIIKEIRKQDPEEYRKQIMNEPLPEFSEEKEKKYVSEDYKWVNQ